MVMCPYNHFTVNREQSKCMQCRFEAQLEAGKELRRVQREEIDAHMRADQANADLLMEPCFNPNETAQASAALVQRVKREEADLLIEPCFNPDETAQASAALVQRVKREEAEGLADPQAGLPWFSRDELHPGTSALPPTEADAQPPPPPPPIPEAPGCTCSKDACYNANKKPPHQCLCPCAPETAGSFCARCPYYHPDNRR